MLEEYLKKEGAKSTANQEKIYEHLKGEVILAVLTDVVELGAEGWDTVFLFESGCSYVQHSKGVYWVNDKETTLNLIRREVEKFAPKATVFKEVSALLTKLQAT